MRECRFCHQDIKGKAGEHYDRHPDCYKKQQLELSRKWKRAGADLPGCYKVVCKICNEPVYGEHPGISCHAGPCITKARKAAWTPQAEKTPQTRPCVACGKPMIAVRDRRKYCSNACYKRVYAGPGTERYKQRLERARRKRQDAKRKGGDA